MKRIFLALAAITLCLPQFARADDVSKHAKIEEMIRLTKMDETMTKMMNETKQQIDELVAANQDSGLPPAQAAIMKDFQSKVSALMLSTLSFEQVKPAMIKLYDDAYTEAELDGILAFYKTPSGQAMLAKTPDLMSKVMAIVNERMTALEPQVEKLADDMQRQMSAAEPKPAIAPEPPALAPAPPDAAAPMLTAPPPPPPPALAPAPPAK